MIQFKTVENKRYMESIEVTVSDGEVLVSDGFICNAIGDKQAIEGVSFTLDKDNDTDVIYDLYVVETEGTFAYELLKTYTANNFTACYDGEDKLIHTFISILVTNDGELNGHVTTIQKQKDGDSIEKNQPERKEQEPKE